MAGLGSDHIGVVAAAAGGPGFVPEIWQDDVIAQYKANLVVANLVSKINHSGRKGDVINLPSITDRKTAVPTAKALNTAVTLVAAAASEIILTINQHWEYSFMYEDITALQALWAEYQGMEPAGGTGATAFDAAVLGSDGSTVWDGTANTNTGNAAALTDAGIRNVIQALDDQDNPMSDRHLIIPPVERNNLMGLARFTEQAFVGEGGTSNTIRNGNIGQIYGVGVYISTNCPYIHTDDNDGSTAHMFSSTALTGTGTDDIGNAYNVAGTDASRGRMAVMQHRGALVHAEQQGVRTQTQYRLDFLGDQFTADCIFGVKEQRDYAAVPIAVAD